MIYIQKMSEPESLRKYRNTPGADFDSMEKTELRSNLLKEQGYLCAYCMKRIRESRDIKIEHYVARNAENQLLYDNLLAVCTGNETLPDERGKVDPKRFTCDSKKKNQVLHIDPQNRADMETIYYDNQGKIYSSNSEYQEDLDKILNLNDINGYLIANRKAALKPLLSKLKSLKPGQSAMPLLDKMKNYCNGVNEHGEAPEYTGILRWYVDRQIRKHK